MLPILVSFCVGSFSTREFYGSTKQPKLKGHARGGVEEWEVGWSSGGSGSQALLAVQGFKQQMNPRTRIQI